MDHMYPHLTQQSPTTHFHTIPFLSFGWPSLPSYFLFFLFFSLIHSSLSLAHPLPPIPPYHHPHHHFSGNVIRKFLGISKHLHLLFEVKVSNLFDGSLQEKQAAAAGLLRRVQKQPLQAAYCGAF